jgi:hypothetical protein
MGAAGGVVGPVATDERSEGFKAEPRVQSYSSGGSGFEEAALRPRRHRPRRPGQLVAFRQPQDLPAELDATGRTARTAEFTALKPALLDQTPWSSQGVGLGSCNVRSRKCRPMPRPSF